MSESAEQQAVTTLSSPYKSAVMASNPVRYWPLDDAVGSSSVTDLASNSSGNIYGGVTLGASDPWDQYSAAAFDGATGEIIDSTAWSIATVNSPYSIEFFYRTPGAVGGMIEFNSGSGSGSGIGGSFAPTVYMATNGTILSCTDYSTAHGAVTVADSSVTNFNNWHHCVITFDGSAKLSLYRDGILNNTASSLNDFVATSYWRMGHTRRTSQGTSSGDGWFTGSLSHVAIYSRAISANEVAAHYGVYYNTWVTPAPPPAYLSYQNNIVSAGPSRYWPLTDSSGSATAHELVSNSTGIIYGGVVLGTRDPWGQPYAATFDGVSGGIVDSTAWTIATNRSSYTVEFFYKTTGTISGMVELNAAAPGSPPGGSVAAPSVHMRNSPGTTLATFQYYQGPGALYCVDSSTSNDGKWHHCAATFDGYNMAIYRDGVQDGTLSVPGVQAGSRYWRMGNTFVNNAGISGPSGFFTGSISHVAIYNRTLSASEIAIHYTSWANTISLAVTPPIPPSEVWVELLDNNLNSQGLIQYATVNAQLYYNAVGSWSILAEYSDALWNQMMHAPINGEFIIRVNWRGLFTFGGKCEQPSYMDSVPGSTGITSGGGLAGPFISLSGADYLSLLANRIVYPAPTKAWSAQLTNDAYAMVNVQLETAIKNLVNLNVGSGAISSRQMSLLDIAPDQGRGPAVNYVAKFNSGVDLNLLDVIRSLIAQNNTNSIQDGTRMGLRITQNGNRLLFDVFIPRDLSKTAWFSEDTGNLTSISFSLTDPTCTDALVQGSTAFVQAESNLTTQWNKVEQYIDNSSETSTPNLTAAAQDALISGTLGPNMNTTVTDTPFLVFGRDFNLGDIVSVQIRNGDSYTDIVSGVTLTADATQQPVINVVPIIGLSSSSQSTDNKIIAQLVARIKAVEKRLSTK
jgi:hypothetical protein